MAGELLVSIMFGIMIGTLALVMGAGLFNGLIAYTAGGALWLTSGLVPYRRKH